MLTQPGDPGGDTDERVRAKAADEIGDQVGDHPDCAVPEIVAALKLALGDCDKRVRREARLALSDCGIDVVRVKDGSCARPAENCAPRPPAAPKAQLPASSEKSAAVEPAFPSDEFLQAINSDFESESELIEGPGAPEEPVAKPAGRRGLSGLIELGLVPGSAAAAANFAVPSGGEPGLTLARPRGYHSRLASPGGQRTVVSGVHSPDLLSHHS